MRVLTTLSGLAEAAQGVTGPALLMVGESMAMADTSTDLPGEGRGSGEAQQPLRMNLGPGPRRENRVKE